MQGNTQGAWLKLSRLPDDDFELLLKFMKDVEEGTLPGFYSVANSSVSVGYAIVQSRNLLVSTTYNASKSDTEP